LCKTFGWTIEECYNQPSKDLMAFSVLLDEMNKQEKIANERAMAKTRNIRRK